MGVSVSASGGALLPLGRRKGPFACPAMFSSLLEALRVSSSKGLGTAPVAAFLAPLPYRQLQVKAFSGSMSEFMWGFMAYPKGSCTLWGIRVRELSCTSAAKPRTLPATRRLALARVRGFWGFGALAL